MSLSRRTNERSTISFAFASPTHLLFKLMTTQRAYALGYLIAALIFAPLTAWAKASADGAWFLYIAVSIGISACILIRIFTGEWP
jgi:hypothetical protein